MVVMNNGRSAVELLHNWAGRCSYGGVDFTFNTAGYPPLRFAPSWLDILHLPRDSWFLCKSRRFRSGKKGKRSNHNLGLAVGVILFTIIVGAAFNSHIMGLTKVLDFSDYLQTVWECLPAVDPGSESCGR
ncbi:hypothetical protein J6590_106956, partial [Homalodisca vitripennis]